MLRGKIIHERAYAQGKMLDHSAWNGKLKNKGTISDIDGAYHCGDEILLFEYSKHTANWRELSYGQRALYYKMARKGIVAVLCRHNVHWERQIDTLNDIEEFSWLWAEGEQIKLSGAMKGKWLPRWIQEWEAGKIRCRLTPLRHESNNPDDQEFFVASEA